MMIGETEMIDSTNLTSRRALLAGLAASTAAMVAPQTVFAVTPRRPSPLSALLDTFADELLVLNPTSATGLGLDTGKHAGLRGKLDEAGLAGREKAATQFASMRARRSTC